MTAGSGGPGRPGGARPVVLALGSNLGDRLGYLQAGADALSAGGGVAVTAVSAVYETSPVGGPDQPDYLNAVLTGTTTLAPRDLLARCQAAERSAGRERGVRWGARTLDIDVIALGDEVSGDPELTLPHPRAHERAFVLVPWRDADPAASLPGRGPVAALLAGLDARGVRRRDDLTIVLRGAPARRGG